MLRGETPLSSHFWAECEADYYLESEQKPADLQTNEVFSDVNIRMAGMVML